MLSQPRAATAPRVNPAADGSAGGKLGIENLALRGRVRSSSRPPATHAGDPTHHEHRTGDSSLPGDPGIPVDLQTSADPVLLDWTNWIDAEAEFAALRYFALSRTDHHSHAEQDDAIAGSIHCAMTAPHPALRGQLQDPGPDYLPCVA